MGRSEIREQVFKLVYQSEFYEAEQMKEQMALYFEEMETISEQARLYIEERVMQILDCKDELDEVLNEKTTGWKTDRMGRIDLAVLRLAVFEIQKDEDIPVKVAINEAVELAKKFGREESAGFINGVLAKVVQ